MYDARILYDVMEFKNRDLAQNDDCIDFLCMKDIIFFINLSYLHIFIVIKNLTREKSSK